MLGTVTVQVERAGELVDERGPMMLELGGNLIHFEHPLQVIVDDVLIINFNDRPKWRVRMEETSPVVNLRLELAELDG